MSLDPRMREDDAGVRKKYYFLYGAKTKKEEQGQDLTTKRSKNSSYAAVFKNEDEFCYTHPKSFSRPKKYKFVW